jgi:hypothetical protein
MPQHDRQIFSLEKQPYHFRQNVDKKRPPVEQKEEEAVRLPRLSPQAAEGAIY